MVTGHPMFVIARVIVSYRVISSGADYSIEYLGDQTPEGTV